MTAPAASGTTASAPLTVLEQAVAITAGDPEGRPPVLRTAIALEQDAARIASAELLATAHGVYEASIDGAPVTDSVLNPGWTAYDDRLQVQRFDVTDLLRSASSAPELSIRLAGGWWHGNLGFEGANANYGPDTALLAALVVTYEDGAVQTVVTDESWSATLSTVEHASLYAGQREDRRLEAEDAAVRAVEIDRATLIEQASPLIGRREVLRPQRIWTSPSGKTLVDFGRNLVGWIRFAVAGPEGTEITLRHAEVLEHEELGTRPLRGAEATDRQVLAGTGEPEAFEPTLTFHGFRYAEVTGWPGELTADDLEAVVVHSRIERTGTFECSNDDVNQLVSNVVWGQTWCGVRRATSWASRRTARSATSASAGRATSPPSPRPPPTSSTSRTSCTRGCWTSRRTRAPTTAAGCRS